MYFNLVVWKIRHDTIVFLTYYRVNHLYFLWEMSQHLGSQEPIDKHSRILSFRVILFKRISLNNNQFSHSVVADFLQPHGLQHTRLPCPSPTPRTCSNSCPLSLWCHPTISSSVIPFSSHLNLSQHQGLYQWVSSSHQVAKVLKLQHQSFQWIFRVDFL